MFRQNGQTYPGGACDTTGADWHATEPAARKLAKDRTIAGRDVERAEVSIATL